MRADLMNELYGGRAGILDTSVGKASKVFPGHFCVYIIVQVTTAVTAGWIGSWDEGLGNEGKARQRTSNSRMPAGVFLDDGSADDCVRLAVWGFVDCAYDGTARTAVGDPIQAGDTTYHKAMYGFGANQMGHSASKTDTNYSAGWVRLHLTINQR